MPPGSVLSCREGSLLYIPDFLQEMMLPEYKAEAINNGFNLFNTVYPKRLFYFVQVG